jgi:hypothetical protein
MKKISGYNLNLQLVNFDKNYRDQKAKLEKKYAKKLSQQKSELEKSLTNFKKSLKQLDDQTDGTELLTATSKLVDEQKIVEELTALKKKNQQKVKKFIFEKLSVVSGQ